MLRYWLLVAGVMSLTACAASMVSKPGSLSMDVENGPVNERERPGVVKYLNDGIGAVREARRRDAYRKMHEACGGDYRIVTEGARLEGGVVVHGADVSALLPSHYWYIQFQCVAGS